MVDVLNIDNGTTSNSPYKNLLVYEDGSNNIYLGLDVLTSIDLSDASEYIVKSGEEFRYDLISFRVLGDPKYFWAILAANLIRNPLDGIPAGTSIQVPSIASIQKSLNNQFLVRGL